jgi:hypothetical protein
MLRFDDDRYPETWRYLSLFPYLNQIVRGASSVFWLYALGALGSVGHGIECLKRSLGRLP